jgi:hypothetical protein
VAQAAPAIARSGEQVVLDGTASSGAISLARWAQVAGPRVMIVDADSLAASFVAPPVGAPTVVTVALSLRGRCRGPLLRADVDVTILPPTGVALIALEETSVVAGETAIIDVRLHTDVPVARVTHHLALGPALAFVAFPGRPLCVPSTDLGDAAVHFELVPPGCSADGCTGIRVAIEGSRAIADRALLYTCTVAGVGQSPSQCGYPYDCCDHPLACDAASAAGVDGTPVPAQCVEGVVHVRHPQPAAEFVFSVDPPVPRVGEVVRVTVDMVRTGRGLIGRPRYYLIGTEPFFAGGVSSQRPLLPGPVTYELRAAQAGTAELSVSILFEAEWGCPGNDFYSSSSLGSDTHRLTIDTAACAGDCDGDGRVAVDEVITGVRMVLGETALAACPAMDGDGSGGIHVDDLVAAVRLSLDGCAAPVRPGAAAPDRPW